MVSVGRASPVNAGRVTVADHPATPARASVTVVFPRVTVEFAPGVPVVSVAPAGAASESKPVSTVTVVIVSAAEAGTAIPPASAAEQARTSAVRVIEPMSETPIAIDECWIWVKCLTRMSTWSMDQEETSDLLVARFLVW
jgi:hypothetical protein